MADLKQIKIPKQISNTLNSVNKTISENKDLKINVNSNIVLEKDDTLNLPSISNIFNYEDMRSAADSFALKKKYHNEEIGRNNRLDELQAMFLRIKLKSILKENKKREVLAKRYIENLSKEDIPIKLPIIRDENLKSSWHLFVILVKNRNDLSDFLFSRNIDTMKHYPIAPHKQSAFKSCDLSKLKLPISEEIHDNCLSLPISYLHTEDEIDYVSEIILKYFRN